MTSRGAVVGLGLLALAACGPSKPVPEPACALSLEYPEGLDVLISADGGCHGSLALGLRVATGSPDAPVWSDPASASLRVVSSWVNQGTAAVREVSVVNIGTSTVSLVGLEWSTPDGGVGFTADRLLQNGYQSWSYTGVLPLPSKLKEENGTAPHGGDNEDLTGEQRGVSWWWTWLGDASGHGLVVGATGGTVLKTYLAVDGPKRPRLRIVQGVTGDAIAIGPGRTLELDGLWLSFGEATARLDEYAATVAATDHRPAAPRPAVIRKPPLGGWGSWNLYYANVTAQDLRTEAVWAKEHLAPLGLTDFLLDDGYEPSWGQWFAATKFGASLETLAAEQKAQGLVPAIWLAPVYVDVTDPLVSAHPDWFVHTAEGKLRTYTNFGPSYAALDVSHPGARAHVTSSLQQLWAWGVRTFKLDFLFGAAIEGVRQEPMTGLQSYARWMQVIREAVPDAHLVGCGAPLLPSVGTFDSMRTGADIALSVGPEPSYPFLASQARQTITRAYTDRFWALDPDVFLLRGTGLSDAEAWTAVVADALSGGNALFGDLKQASATRQAMALAPQVVALLRDGRAARPVDLPAQLEAAPVASPLIAQLQGDETRLPHVWRKTSADGNRGALAIFGWDVEGYQVQVELPAGAKELVPPTSESTALGEVPLEGKQTVTVAKHAARLFTW